MPISFLVIPEKNYFIATWEGGVTDSELLDSYTSFFQGSEWTPSLHEIADLSKVSVPSISSHGLKQFAELIEQTYKQHNISEARIAVVSTNPFDKSMVEFYGVLTRELPETISVFSDIDQAESWLVE